jgi:hypothetical protein
MPFSRNVNRLQYQAVIPATVLAWNEGVKDFAFATFGFEEKK